MNILSKGWFRFYFAHFRIDMAVRLQYRVDSLFYALTVILLPVIYLSVWSTAAGEGAIKGYTASGFAAYYILVLVINHFTDTWSMWTYEDFVRSGSFSNVLLYPIHPVHNEIAPNVAHKLFSLLFLLPAIGLLIVLFQPSFNLSLQIIFLFFPALILAAALAFVLGWIVAILAFWTTRMSAINQIYFLSMMFFSGQFAPLSLMPGWLQITAAFLPFRWIVAFPIDIMLGQLNGRETLTGYAIQMGWIFVLALMAKFVWEQGVRQYSAVGG